MNPFERLASQSPFPIVDLRHITKPEDGLILELSTSCHKNFDNGVLCREHYDKLAHCPPTKHQPIQCPFGFASYSFMAGDVFAALTGFIPFPRLGGSKERIEARRHNNAKIATGAVKKSALGLAQTQQHFLKLEESVLQSHSMALHEIRKLNRTVKHNAERLCRQASPEDIDKAPKELVTIYKTSELMSNEYDVIEVLANLTQAELPLNRVSELYKVFDKCVRIYKAVAGGRRLLLRAEYGYSPRIVVSDKTFHIIPSVFIENALKYSLPGSEIRITLEPDSNNENCILTVTNESEGNQQLDDRVFQRGFRASSLIDGSGNGLYVAQAIAKQHNTQITVESTLLSSSRVKHTFTVAFKTTHEKFVRKTS